MPISSAWVARVEARSVSPAPSARDRRGHAAAHRAARHGHGQDHERKYQGHGRQRFHAEPPDIRGFGDHHASTRAERNHVRPREPQQGSQNRPVNQRVPRRRLDRRKRLLVFVYGYFGDADIGHLCFLKRFGHRCASTNTSTHEGTLQSSRRGLPSTIRRDIFCVKRMGCCAFHPHLRPVTGSSISLPTRRRARRRRDQLSC